MKAFLFTIVSLLIVAEPAFATYGGSSSPNDRVCRREFAHDLFKCVITSFFQKAKVRADKLKTCVVAAKDERNLCLNPSTGPSPCEQACQATFDADVIACNEEFDPSICRGNAQCEASVQAARATCISDSTDRLGVCNQTCQ